MKDDGLQQLCPWSSADVDMEVEQARRARAFGCLSDVLMLGVPSLPHSLDPEPRPRCE